MTHPLKPLMGIGISTKDRWDILPTTLTHLKKEGLDKLEILVIDDGSSIPLPESFRKEFPWVKFERFEKSLGISARRNYIARSLSTPLFLSLDDDSYPVAGRLDEAATWLTDHPEACSLGFTIVNRSGEIPKIGLNRSPFPIRCFTACAALLKRELFISLGGFEERFVFFSEETEYCLKAYQQNYETYAYPAVVIRHELVSGGTMKRNFAGRTYLFIRNGLLVGFWYYPFPRPLLTWLRALPSYFIASSISRKNWLSLVMGWINAPFCFWRWSNDKQRLSPQQFHRWKRLLPPCDPREDSNFKNPWPSNSNSRSLPDAT